MLYYAVMESPIGTILLQSDGVALTALSIRPEQIPDNPEEYTEMPNCTPLPEAMRQLTAYFNGTLTSFTLPLAPQGTAFQLKVWQKLLEIPFGCCLSYGDLAMLIGNGNASRAVGLANSRNPLPIIIPCHRVIGANGDLVGYSGGLDVKKHLLSHEESIINPKLPL